VTRPLLLAATLALLLATSSQPAAGQETKTAWTATLLAGELEAPVDLVFGPDGTLYYAELATGKIRAIPPGANAPLPEALAEVKTTMTENGGFLGLALDPDFEETGAFFVYYSFEKAGAKNGQVNRVSRIDAEGERVLLDDIPYFERHNGGRLVFTGPDTLVVSVGDNELRAPAQDRASLLGKMLRMTREGEPAPDNPDPTSLVYTFGHRNAFGLAWDAESGTLWSTENGPQSRDEINVITAGGNYGWPDRLGYTQESRFVSPVFVHEATIGPTGATVLDGELYYGAVNDGKLRHLARQANGSYAAEVVWDGVTILDVEAGPDGRLYVGSFKDITVLTPPGGEPPAHSLPTPPPKPTTPPASTSPGVPATTSPPPTESSEAPTGAAAIPGPGVALAFGALVVALATLRRGQR